MATLRDSGILFFMVIMASLLRVSMGVVYTVGDSTGWTTLGNFDYKRWAAAKTFHVGDTFVFQYNPKFHNVIQVGYEDFKACNVQNPIATYKGGNDSITIKVHGHYFYTCAEPGHCQAGQKVDIRVPLRSSPKQSTAPSSAAFPSKLPSPSSSPSPSPSPSDNMGALAPTGNSASLLSMSILWLSITVGLAYFGV